MEILAQKVLEHPQAYLIVEQIKTLLREEYTRRTKFYKEVKENQKTEFINGEIMIHSPVMKRHNEACSLLHVLLSTYINKYQLGFVGIEKIMISLTRNDYEPDLCFFRKEKARDFKADQMRFPAPDFIVEVLSKSTEKNDRGLKYKDYEAHQIEEYWLIDPQKKSLEQYHLEQGKYQLILKSQQGTIRSFVAEGFEIEIQSIFDTQANIEMLHVLSKE